MTQLIHKLQSSEEVLESDTSDKDGSSESCSGQDKGVAESDGEGNITPVVTEIGTGGDGHGLEHAGEWYLKLR